MVNSEWRLQEVNHLMSQTCCEKCINMCGFETFPKNQSSIWNWFAVKKKLVYVESSTLRFPQLKVESSFQQKLISVLFRLTVHQSLIEKPRVQPMPASGTTQHIRSETSKAAVFVMTEFVVGPVGPLMTTAGMCPLEKSKDIWNQPMKKPFSAHENKTLHLKSPRFRFPNISQSFPLATLKQTLLVCLY